MSEEFSVLLIDDNPINARVLEGYLTGLSVKIMTARNGIEGLHLARKYLPDVILLDVLMPGLDGFEVCEQIRFDPLTNPIPVVFITSSEDVTERVTFTKGSFPDAVLTKPIKKNDLLILLRSLFRLVSHKKKLEQEAGQLRRYTRRLEEATASSMADVAQSEEMSIFVLAKLAESRDPDTGEHLLHISEYCRILAENLRQVAAEMEQLLTDSYVETLSRAAPLHDIGKVGIPDSILRKHGKYTPKEMERMKQHVAIGRHLLETAINLYGEKPFLKFGLEIAQYHHEYYDGSGYLDGRAGEAIPLSARIVALADVYDAITSKRIYKDAMSHDVARHYIIENKGRHFDPLLVESFLSGEEKFRAIHNGKYPFSTGECSIEENTSNE